MLDVCNILQTRKTCTFHSQSDDATERVIRTVNTMLSKVVDEIQKDWDLHLGSVAIAYNSAEHESTGFTPYFLEYGREMRLPTDFTFFLAQSVTVLIQSMKDSATKAGDRFSCCPDKSSFRASTSEGGIQSLSQQITLSSQRMRDVV